MSKKLILQGPDAAQDALARIARLAAPRGMTPLHAHALRCDGIDFTPALKATIDAAAEAARVDATFIDAGRTLADFKLVAMDMDSTRSRTCRASSPRCPPLPKRRCAASWISRPA
jgi:phosphoserine phosphatase